jgi:hypothetical protein
MNVLRMIETFHEHKIKEQDMTNQENPFPQMSNEQPLAPNPSVSQEEFHLDEEQLEAVAGGMDCFGCWSKTPENAIRTQDGKVAGSYDEAMREWEKAHPTPEARQAATWYPQGVLTKVGRNRKDGTYSPGKEMWVKGPVGPVQS